MSKGYMDLRTYLKIARSLVIDGKSVGRTLTNLNVQDIELNGNGIDLGAKHGSSSYHSFLKRTTNCSLTFSDLHPTSPDVLRVDLEKEISVDSDSQDFLLLFNVLEHLYNYRQCLDECYRVLRPSGYLYGSVPFLRRVHPDPDDHFRYTGSTLRRLFSDVGFSDVRVAPLGMSIFTAASSQIGQLFPFSFVRGGMHMFAITIDLGLLRVFPNKDWLSTEYNPIALTFVAQK